MPPVLTPAPFPPFGDELAEELAGDPAFTDAFVAIADVSGAGFAKVATQETTTSTSFTDLATPGPGVTVTVPESGAVKMTISASMFVNVSDTAQITYTASGANTIAADANNGSLGNGNTGAREMSRVLVLEGLTPGETTFTLKYRTNNGNIGNFARRGLLVEPLPFL